MANLHGVVHGAGSISELHHGLCLRHLRGLPQDIRQKLSLQVLTMENEVRQRAWLIIDRRGEVMSISLLDEEMAWGSATLSTGHGINLLKQCGWRCVAVWVSPRNEDVMEEGQGNG